MSDSERPYDRKRSFILYPEQFQCFSLLNMEERGQLITAIFEYEMNGEEPVFDSRVLGIAFSSIRPVLDLNREKYEKKCVKNKENASKRTQANASDGSERKRTLAMAADNDNDNDNDNDKKDTPNGVSKEKKSDDGKKKFGLHENVMLTAEEHAKLQEQFPLDYHDRIDNLSDYIAAKGVKYKSHYATIRMWARKDSREGPNEVRAGNKTDTKHFRGDQKIDWDELDDLLYNHG